MMWLVNCAAKLRAKGAAEEAEEETPTLKPDPYWRPTQSRTQPFGTQAQFCRDRRPSARSAARGQPLPVLGDADRAGASYARG